MGWTPNGLRRRRGPAPGGNEAPRTHPIQTTEESMKRTNLFPALTLVAALAVAPVTGWTKTSELPRSMGPQTAKDAASTVEWLQQKVRHELVMLPYYSVFDHITYKVEGDRVELTGQVYRPT